MKTNHLIPHNKPSVGKEEAQAAYNIITSQWIIAGKEVEKFENSIKIYCNKKYAVAVNSGHSALHLSLIALEVSDGDEVILPSYIPPDLLNAVYYCRAVPVLVDIEKSGFNIDPSKIKEKITPKTKAIIAPHIFGRPIDILKIKTLGIPVIEDCAQSLGSYYKNKPLGSFGNISIFSFYATKLITTGQGGMVCTDNEKYYKKIKNLIDYNGRCIAQACYNYPMTDIAAAIGNIQLKKLSKTLKKRKLIGDRYRKILKSKNINYFPYINDTDINHFRFLLKFKNIEQVKKVQRKFTSLKISTILPYPPEEMPHNILKLDKKNYPNAQNLSETLLSIPIFPTLTEEEIQRIEKSLEDIL